MHLSERVEMFKVFYAKLITRLSQIEIFDISNFD